MEKQIVLSPEELYYLGAVLQAKYIDYAYIAAMDDIGQNYDLFAKETCASLVAKGVLLEDFSGNIEVDDKALELLKPIFFGEAETSVDICKLGDNNSVSVYKFHFHDGVVTMVSGKDGKLFIKMVDQIYIKDMIAALIPEDYCESSEVLTDIPQDKITRFFAFKSILVGKNSVIKTYIEANGTLYYEKDDEHIESVSRETFVSDVYEIVKGI